MYFCPSQDGITVLHAASQFGNTDLCKYLVELGADISRADKVSKGFTNNLIWLLAS